MKKFRLLLVMCLVVPVMLAMTACGGVANGTYKYSSIDMTITSGGKTMTMADFAALMGEDPSDFNLADEMFGGDNSLAGTSIVINGNTMTMVSDNSDESDSYDFTVKKGVITPNGDLFGGDMPEGFNFKITYKGKTITFSAEVSMSDLSGSADIGVDVPDITVSIKMIFTK